MKDRKNMVMVIIIGITISLFLCFNTTVFATTGIVTTSDLRLRKEESTSSEILTLLDENDEVEILSENGDWYKVKANNKVGFVSKEFIKVKNDNNENSKTESENTQNNESDSSEKNEESNTEVKQESNDINKNQQATISSEEQIRIVPLINGDIINTTKSGEQYDVVSNVGVWSYVKNSEKSGWILSEKLTIINENTQNNTEVVSEENNENGTEQNQNEDTTTEQDQNENTQEQTSNNEEEQTEEKEVSSTEKTYSEAKTYYVKGTSVNVRSDKNKTSEVIDVLNTNEQVKVTGEDGDWYIVSINGKKAYISKSLLSSKKVETTSRSSTSVQTTTEQATETTTTTASNPNGEAIVAYAKTFLGYPYVYGNNGPNSFDCSGFVQYVYKHFGYSLSRSSKTQANDGVAVSKSNLQPGDIIIFKNSAQTEIGHVGIYIGDNQFIHASNSKTGVIISSLSTSAYQQRYVTARRIL